MAQLPRARSVQELAGMGAWWANDPWFWWELLAVLGAIIAALVALVIVVRLGSRRRPRV